MIFLTKLKYALIVFILFIIGVLFFSKMDQYVIVQDFPLLGKVIYIDAGHGGRDPGTNYQNILEKDLNLAISKKLEKLLLEQGAIVYQVREEDKDFSSQWDEKKKRSDLYRRIKMIEQADSDIYLSIHINWYQNSKYKGAEVLYYPSNPNNKILGEMIMKEFKHKLKSDRKLVITDLFLYKTIKTPGVLIECGFLSNYNERTLLTSDEYQYEIASAITKGVKNYFANLKV